MPRPNLKFKIFGEGGGPVIFPCPGQIWNFNLTVKVWGSVIFPYLGKIWNLKFSVRVWGSVIFSCPGQFWNLYCLVRSGVSHLSMSRPNLKFKILVRLGSVIFPCQGQIWNLKTFHESLGLVIFLCPGQIWNLKISVRVGGRASYHVQTQSEIEKFQWGLGVSHLSMSRHNLKLKIFGGVDHLSMSRPNLKFKLFGVVGGQSSFHVQAKSEI